jgi:hypothetical protein
LLTTIVGSWRDWERAASKEKDCAFDEEGGGVLGTLFRTLHVLLRDDHPYREFNAAQLNRVRMVEALLLFCKVGLLYCNMLFRGLNAYSDKIILCGILRDGLVCLHA